MTVAELRKLLEGKNPEADIGAVVIRGHESWVCDINGLQSHGAEKCLMMVFIPEQPPGDGIFEGDS